MKTSRGGAGMKLVLALAVILACAALAWMVLLPRALARSIRARTGFDVAIQSLYCNPLTANLDLRGLVITNPPTFPRKDFVNLREFRVNARLTSLLGRRWVVDDATVDFAGVSVVRDQKGRVNARLFQEGLAGAAASPPSAKAAREATGRTGREFLIKRLTLRIERVVIADYSLPKPETREYNLNFSRTYENVTSARQLAVPLAEALGNLSGILTGAIPESSGVLRDAGNTLKQAGRRTGEAVKGLFESLEKSFQK